MQRPRAQGRCCCLAGLRLSHGAGDGGTDGPRDRMVQLMGTGTGLGTGLGAGRGWAGLGWIGAVPIGNVGHLLPSRLHATGRVESRVVLVYERPTFAFDGFCVFPCALRTGKRGENWFKPETGSNRKLVHTKPDPRSRRLEAGKQGCRPPPPV